MKKRFEIEWDDTNSWQRHFANSIFDWIKFYTEQKSKWGVPKVTELPRETYTTLIYGGLYRGWLPIG